MHEHRHEDLHIHHQRRWRRHLQDSQQRASRQESTQNKKVFSKQRTLLCKKKEVEKRKERSFEADNEVLKEKDSVNHPS